MPEADSLRFDQFTVATSWLFVVLNGIALGLAVAPPFGDGHRSHLVYAAANLYINLSFTAFYCAYLASFALQGAPAPSATYTSALVMYTVGCACFVAHFGVKCGLVRDDGRHWHFLAGSLFFLVGSVQMVWATSGSGRCRARSAAHARGRSLFWGSVLFLVGSALFLLDWRCDCPGASHYLGEWGLAVFLPGRLLFVHGSTTESCDLWLRDASIAGTVADALGAEEEGLPRQMARMSPCCSPAARSPLPSPRGQQELDSLLADQTPG